MSGSVDAWEIDAEILFEEIQDSEAKKCAKKIAKRSPKGIRRKYADGWTSDKTVDSNQKREVVVHNASEPTLTHLLEYGHLTNLKHGNKGKKRVAPIPHIRSSFSESRSEYIKKMENAKIKIKTRKI